MATKYVDEIIGVPIALPTIRDLGVLAPIWKDNGSTTLSPTTNTMSGYQVGRYVTFRFLIVNSNSALTNPVILELPAGYNIVTGTGGVPLNGGSTGYIGTADFFDGTTRTPIMLTRFNATTNQFFFSNAGGNVTSANINGASKFIEGTISIPITELITTEFTAYGAGDATSTKSGLVKLPGSAKTTVTAGTLTTASTTLVDMSGVTLSITLTKSARIGFALASSVSNNTLGIATILNVQVNGTNQFGTSGIYFQEPVVGYFLPIGISGVSDVLAAGTYTVKAQWKVASSSTASALADAGNSTVLSAWEI